MEAREDFWSMPEDFIYRHHVMPRDQLNISQQSSFPDPVTSTDVHTETNLKNVEERSIDDSWNIEGNRINYL